jgi:hypothetical protein
MGKVTGATLEFWYGGVEHPVESVTFDAAWEELETTDSSTQTPATEFLVNRAKRTGKVDQMMGKADGSTIATGSLVALTKYKVKLGSVTEGSTTYPVGKIFTSDGTGAATASNQVATVGTKVPGKSIICSIAGNNCGVLNMKYSEQYGEFDSTDSDSPSDTTEFITGRVKRTTSIELIMKDTTADLVSANPAPVAVVLTFETGQTLTGSAVFTKKGHSSIAKGDMVKSAYDMTWIGPVTSTLYNQLTLGVSTAAKAIWKRGASTNREVTGNMIVMNKSIEADVNGIVKISYGVAWVGAVTEAIYS